ncbi:Uncharacterized conserved protein UCP029693 [Candidatus Magnetomorum sp. HK-1]|nr:Uncharacterized conserved protein UCP029693 [Candidatus Magnetomorum sp. HK-1]
MFQSQWRWSDIVSQSSLLTVLTVLLAGLFFLNVSKSIASPLNVEDSKNFDVQATHQDENVPQNEKKSDLLNDVSNTFQKKAELLIPQTETSPQNLEPRKSPQENSQENLNETAEKNSDSKIPEADPKKANEDTETPQAKSEKVLDKKAVSKSKTEKPKKIKKKPPKEKIPEKIVEQPQVRGKAFVEGIITPLNNELNERFWGWRPNDFINVTDNVNNLQLGILEVTRRAVVVLAHRISRTGSNDTIDVNLENAMNWLMVKAQQYWFPSPESKYNQAIDELNQYINRLERGRASFFSRTDNLIPLLEHFEDLLGGCDKNLTIKEDEEGPISSSKADNYFYYAQGVAMAMGSIFRGIRKDFLVTLDSVQGTEIIDQAIKSCDNATNIDPWIITEGSFSSIFANHRANIDQPINRIRFYMNVLIRTLKGY